MMHKEMLLTRISSIGLSTKDAALHGMELYKDRNDANYVSAKDAVHWVEFHTIARVVLFVPNGMTVVSQL